MVPQGTAEKAGSHPVSLENDSAEAQRFADELQEQLDEENSEIRQQDLSISGEERAVWIQWGDNSLDGPQKMLVDKMLRVYVPIHMFANGQRRKIKGVSFSGNATDVIKVAYTEPRYSGEDLKYLACYLGAQT
jgi:hypothetical protein